MKRPALLVGLLVVLTAAAGLSLYPVTVEQLRKNRVQWLALPESERDELRARWAAFEGEPEAVHRQVMRRLATLERMQAHEGPDGASRSDEDIERVLQGLAGRLRRILDADASQGEAGVAQELRGQTRRRIDAFLDNLVAAERITKEERLGLAGSSWDDFVQRALEIRKREEIYLYSEFSSRVERDHMEGLPPLDVVDEMLEVRRLRGFLGEAGRVLGLSEEEQRQLAAAKDEEFFPIAKRLMEPKARQYMSERLHMDEEQIDRVLSRPYRDLERSLHRLVLSTR